MTDIKSQGLAPNRVTTKSTFGKFKGQELTETPSWYQTWLLNQKWFNVSNSEKPLHQQLNAECIK